MLSLNDREWKDFRVSDLFTEIQSTKGIDTGKLVQGDDVPYIAASKENNGYKGMFSSQEYSDWVSKGNGIVVIQLGDGAAGLAWYVPMNFIGMNGKTSVCYNCHLNQYNGVFIAKSMSINKERFSHGYSWTGNRLLSTKVMLPVNSSGQPDYDFMEAYSKEQEQEKIKRYTKYCKNCLSALGSATEVDEVSQKEWHDFFVDDIFTIDSGKRLESYNMTAGIKPFIGATDSGNGVTNYISNENESLDSNVLGVNYNGGVGICFYHPYECLFSDDVKRFHLKKHPDNKYVLLFLKTLILQQKAKYNYGYKFNATRMKRQKIMLPVTEFGEPDYDYMEQYTKKIMLKKYKQYFDFLEAKGKTKI